MILFNTGFQVERCINEQQALRYAKTKFNQLEGITLDKVTQVNAMFTGILFGYNLKKHELFVMTENGKLPFE